MGIGCSSPEYIGLSILPFLHPWLGLVKLQFIRCGSGGALLPNIFFAWPNQWGSRLTTWRRSKQTLAHMKGYRRGKQKCPNKPHLVSHEISATLKKVADVIYVGMFHFC
jgi:hypothetical protein